ncbi:transcription factor TFIIIB subunit brf1 [Cladophialophora chaetospira]|uniref:Transcription factor TFIIIB subunit brf1 n=1 Tax=Cladophialophora chaetospira TaxID=386627 RepID=A0AA38XBN7_9EURO|nr:transcription factor TFIIIB subunit brf1 [Cladophialophora chaetospira]
MPPALKPPPPKPRAGQHRRPVFRGRIEGLGSPAPTSLSASSPTIARASTPISQPQTRGKVLCPNPDCPDRSKVTRTDQGLICESCGALVQEDAGLVSEQGFGETDSGRIVATGVQIGQDQTHQRTYTTGGAFGNAGREATSNNERTRNQAKGIMNSYATIFNIQSSDVEKGSKWFGLACSNGFLAGRTIESVAVAALFIACRRRKEQVQGVQRPVYGLMLIDFAERLNMDVFALGKIYRDLYEKLWYDRLTGVWKEKEASADFQGMDPAVLVPKFVRELDFDKRDEPKIQNDAIQIIKRMKRDWIHLGRRPSGVCGAAVLLAARMNNYRRTTREVVLSAKVTEITLNKRLQEFQDTQSSKLSVNRFMQEAKTWEKLEDGVWHDSDERQPPIVKEQMNAKPKRKRGRPRKNPLPETAAEIEGDATPEPQATDDGQPPPAKRVRVDAEGYKIPDIPARKTGGESSQDSDGTLPSPQVESQDTQIDVDASSSQPPSPSRDERAASETPSEATKKRQRGPNWQPPPKSAAEIAMEAGIEDAMDETLDDNPELTERYGVKSSGKRSRMSTPQPTTAMEIAADQQPSLPEQDDATEEPMDLSTDPTQTVPPHRKDKILGPPVNTAIGNLGHVSLSPTLQPEEFDSDEDVSTCTLTEEESRIKERVWVSMNADWLRKDHAKRIRKELKEAELRAKGLDPAEEERKQKAAKGKRKDGTKRPGRRGDVSYLNEQSSKKRKAPTGEDGEGGEVDAEGGEEGEEADEEAEDGPESGTPQPPRTAAEAVRGMMKIRRPFSLRINYDALDLIYGMPSGTSEESAGSRSRSVTGDGASRSGSVAASEASQEEGSGTPGSAGRKKSTPKKPINLFRPNVERSRRRGPLPAAKREKERQARNARKKAAEAAGEAEGSRSTSRSRSTSTSTPASGSGEPSTAPQRQSQAQSPLHTPPATQRGPSLSRVGAATATSPLSNQAGPQIPSVRTAAAATHFGPQIPSILSSGPSGPSRARSTPAARQPSKSLSPEEDIETDDAEEEDELENAFEGRYQARGSDDEDEDEEEDDDDDE